MWADLVFHNGQVITVDRSNRTVEAVAVKGNRIVAVGSNDEMNIWIGEETKQIDLMGKSLLPGIIDSHLHILSWGTAKLAVSCKQPHIQSIGDVLNELKQLAERTPQGQWIRAFGFNDTKIAEQRYPTRWELDEISKDQPIMITRTCHHISIVNSKALELAGIDENTPDPDSGRIGRDENGVPNGVLVETAKSAVDMIASYTEQELLTGIRLASDDFIAAGITSIHDAGFNGPDDFRVMQKAVKLGAVQVRIYAMVGALNNSEGFVDKMVASGVITGTGDERFRVGPAKVFTDGSSSGPTIATREGYTSNPNDYGILYFTQERLNEVLGAAHEQGFQLTAHAQGDRAVEMVLNCIEEALKKHPRDDHRHRIEHSGITPPDLLARMKNLSVIPVPNPPFPYEFGEGYIKNYGDRVNQMYSARDFIDNGIIAAAGSDCPVTHYNPMLGIHVAVNRQTESGTLVGENQRISVLEAIKLYTWNGAYASFEENIKGSIEVGKLADLVILSEPILNVQQERIKDVKVDLTVLDGEIVFQRYK
ncbi:amidohydrolase family protein [Paenibacillus sp. LMG 31458]|uniref:Amidohydrolase family protein n=1 Tax=Paenibacillus phytorum TaxID=2654977 RepID=A0ABX1XPC9_9BACL|nr:amidohydrolase [Paenibacillus phytorum]NOU70395.1 amidohydrolase family protein [Paenibacillus phytorum]